MAKKHSESLTSLIDKCFRCGLCRAVCPVFSQVGREPAVARGKLQVVRAMLSGKGEPPEVALYFLSRCMACGLCQQICPADVRVSEAVIRARVELIPALGSIAAEHLGRFPALGRWRRYLEVIRSAPNDPLPAVMEFLSEVRGQKASPRLEVSEFSESLRPAQVSDPAMRIGYLPGYAERLFPRIAEATLRILEKCRIQVLIPDRLTCSGALFLEAGDLETARGSTRAALEAFGDESIAAVVLSDAGCAWVLRPGYRELLGLDEISVPSYHVSEFLDDRIPRPLDLLPLSERAFFLPSRALGEAEDWSRKLLGCIPELEVVDPEDFGECCGDSLFFSALHPELFDEILKGKLARIESSGCEMVITDSCNCVMQLRWAVQDRGLNIEVRHIVEILAASLGIGSNPSPAASRTSGSRKKC